MSGPITFESLENEMSAGEQRSLSEVSPNTKAIWNDGTQGAPSEPTSNSPQNSNAQLTGQASSEASTESPSSNFSPGGGGNPPWLGNSSSSYFDALTTLSSHALMSPHEEEDNASQSRIATVTNWAANLGLDPTTSSSNLWGDFPTRYPPTTQPQRSASVGECSTNSLDSLGSGSFGTTMQDDRQGTFVKDSDFVSQHDPVSSSIWTSSTSMDHGRGDAFLNRESEESSNTRAVRKSSSMKGVSGGGSQLADDSGSVSAPTSESLIQSAIMAPSQSQWGRTPVDQTTRWPIPPSGNPISSGGAGGDERVESNVWANEPPDGTRVWEEFYETQGLVRAGPPGSHAGFRPIVQHQQATLAAPGPEPTPYQAQQQLPRQASGHTLFQQQQSDPLPGLSSMDPSGGLKSNIFPPPVSSQMWNTRSTSNWSDSANTFSGTSMEAPLLSSPSMEPHMGTSSWMMPPSGQPGSQLPPSAGYHSPYMTTGSAGPTSSMQPPLSSGGPRMKGDMTMRVQQVKFLCGLGFPRADVQQALIMNNMDMDRALNELRTRYNHMQLQNQSNSGENNSYGGSTAVERPSLPLGSLGRDYAATGMSDFSGDPSPSLSSGRGVYGGVPRVNSTMNMPPPRMGVVGSSNNSSMSITSPSSAGLTPQLSAGKVWQNFMLLQTRLRHVNSEMSHLQSMSAAARNGVSTGQQQQLQVAYQALVAQQQRLVQQLQLYQAHLKTFPPQVLAALSAASGEHHQQQQQPSPTSSNTTSAMMVGHLSGHMSDLSLHSGGGNYSHYDGGSSASSPFSAPPPLHYSQTFDSSAPNTNANFPPAWQH